MSDSQLKKTPLHRVYSKMDGVRLVDFGGWEMPVQFAEGILAEHKTVREEAGLFDVSHMGEIEVSGSGAEAFLDYLLTNTITGAETGRCLYTPMCRPDGGVVDDLLVYVMAEARYLLVVNASNIDKDFDWISARLKESGLNAAVRDISAETGQLALQGPQAMALLSPLCEDFNPDEIDYYRHAGEVVVGGIKVILSRTGYTGEDGYELYCPSDDAEKLWNLLVEAGAEPCGLGARDVLRLEARLPLYGHELTDSISPLEAGIGMFVRLEKKDFIGRKVLAAQKENGIPRQLYGLEMVDAAVPREGYEVYEHHGESEKNGFTPGESPVRLLGKVTSGGKSPVRNSFIALALLERGSVKIGERVSINIRGKLKVAEIVRTPFYRRES